MFLLKELVLSGVELVQGSSGVSDCFHRGLGGHTLKHSASRWHGRHVIQEVFREAYDVGQLFFDLFVPFDLI